MSLCASLSHIFQQERALFNQLYADVQWRFPQLEGDQFRAFLISAVNPLVASASSSGRTIDRDWVAVIYTAALELVGQKLAGPAAINTWHNHLWNLFPNLSELLLQTPELIAELSNCVHHVVRHPGSRPQHWLNSFSRCAPLCQTPEQVRQVALIAAWSAGLAHYRSSALNLLNQLDQQLCLRLFDLTANHGTTEKLVKQLQQTPWSRPEPQTQPPAKSLFQCGAFSGFDGVFTKPPRVGCAADQIFVVSNQDCWQLYADTFGTSLQTAPRPAGLNLVTCYPEHVTFSDHQLKTPHGDLSLANYGEITSACYCHQTLAFTTSLSHAILLVPL